MSHLVRISLLLLTLATVAFPAATVFADALVIVQVRTAAGAPAEGTVTLQARSGEGPTHTCETEEGDCRLEGVPGGQYTVSFQPRGGEPTPARPAMIPPNGRVTLHVAAP